MTNSPVLRRDAGNRVVGGVCSGLARMWNVDPLLVRAAAVVAAAVSSGGALVAYLVLWVVLPTDRATGRTRVPRIRPTFIALVAVAAAAAFIVPESRFAAVGFALLGLTFLGWYGVTRAAARRPAARPLEQPTQWRQPPRPGEAARAVQSTPTLAARSWPKLAGLTLLCWAGLATLDALGVDVRPVAYPASALALIGFALVRASRVGRRSLRPRGLVALGFLTATMTALMLGTPTPTAGGVVTYADGQSLPAVVDLGMGNHTLDLSRLTLDRDRTLRVTQDMGNLTVVLPSAESVNARYVVDMGRLSSPTGQFGGLDLGSSDAIAKPGRPTLTIEIELSLGQLEVKR